MSRGQGTFGKRENEKKRLSKRKQKEERKEERQSNAKKGQNLEDMLAYVDEDGNIVSTPPDPQKRKEIDPANIRLGAAPIVEEEPGDAIRQGIVAFFNDSKGYGFIKDKRTQESIFVHANGLINQIKEGDSVTFEVEMGHKGPQAVSVRTATATPTA
jgi:cold shock CspA family protein